MSLRKFAQAALLVVLLLSVPLAAQESLRVSPSTLSPWDESFLTIFVSGLLETDVVTVSFSGPGGTAAVEPTYRDANSIITWVPVELTMVEGTYRVDVDVVRGTGSLHYGPGFFNVEIPDVELPPLGLYLPEVVFGEAASIRGGKVSWVVESTDGTPVSCTPPSGSNFALGTTEVNCTASNALGQTAEGEFPVFVGDTVAPTINVPADISSDSPVVTFTVTAEDSVDPEPDIVCSPSSGSTFPAGVTTVQCYAVDLHANYAFDSFDVTISGGGPVLTVPDDMIVEATSPDGAVVTFTATATEGGVVACTPPSGSVFAIGTTTVTCTATNAAGSDTEDFDVTVRDTTAPSIVQIVASPDVIWPPNHQMVEVTLTVIAFDLGDDTPVCKIVDITSNQPENGTGDGDTGPDMEITGPLTVDVRAERSHNADRVYKMTVECTDDSGNSSTKGTEVKVTQTSRRRSTR